jgi:hypothetical protein
MSAPHVTGAAALLAQAHPDWRAPQLKAALMSTALPIANAGIYDQGAGRLDIGRAATQRVFAEPGSLDFGVVRWPHDGPPVTKTIVYHNDGASPVTLQLVLSFPGRTAPVPAGLFTLSATSLIVPAGGSAAAGLTLTPPAIPDDLIGARLTASDGSGTVLRTPIGVIGEPESYDLILTATGRAGAATGVSVLAVNVDTGDSVFRSRVDAQGHTVLRLRKGTYDVSAKVTSLAPDLAPPRRDVTLLAEPEVALNANLELTLDARPAQPLLASVDDPAATLTEEEVSLVSGGRLGGALIQLGFPFFTRMWAVPSRAATTHPYLFRYEPMLSVGTPPTAGTRYSLVFFEQGRIPDRLAFSARRRELAEIHETYRAQATAAPGVVSLRGNYVTAGGVGPLLTALIPVTVPGEQTQFFTARGVQWRHRLRMRDPGGTIFEHQDSQQTYRPGAKRHVAWNRAPLGPSFMNDGLDLVHSAGHIVGIVPLFSGNEDGHAAFSFEGVTGRTELERNGEPFATSRSSCGGFFAVPPGPARYTLRCVDDRTAPQTSLGTHVEATWTFHDSGDEEHSLPLLAVRAVGQVDPFDRAPAGRFYVLGLRVDRQPRSPAGRVTDLDLEASFDDGATWNRVPVVRLPFGDRALALLRHPAQPGFVSLRAAAADNHGNSVTHTVIRAYQTSAAPE